MHGMSHWSTLNIHAENDSDEATTREDISPASRSAACGSRFDLDFHSCETEIEQKAFFFFEEKKKKKKGKEEN